MIFKLAFLNLWRHRTRSILSLLTISGAIASIIVFRGQSNFVLETLRVNGAENQFGHAQVANKKLWSPESLSIKEQLVEISPELKKEILQNPLVDVMSPRLSLQGLLSFSDNQFGARLVGLVPEQEVQFFESTKVVEGKPLDSKSGDDIILGSGLKKRLKAKVGDSVTIVTQTINGVVNAMDLNVTGVFHTTIAEVDNQLAFVPLKITQTLLDTEKAEVWFLRTKDVKDSLTMTNQLKPVIEKIQPDLEVRHWRQLADLYNRVEDFYNMQNTIIQVILSTLTILAILNTVGMTVYERTGEIGTLRSLGLRRRDIVSNFTLEGIFLAMIGAICGSILGWLWIQGLNAAGLTVAMPGASDDIVIKANFLWSAVAVGTGLGFVATMIGTLIPTFKAARVSIVEALRRNI